MSNETNKAIDDVIKSLQNLKKLINNTRGFIEDVPKIPCNSGYLKFYSKVSSARQFEDEILQLMQLNNIPAEEQYFISNKVAKVIFSRFFDVKYPIIAITQWCNNGLFRRIKTTEKRFIGTRGILINCYDCKMIFHKILRVK